VIFNLTAKCVCCYPKSAITVAVVPVIAVAVVWTLVKGKYCKI